IPNERSFQTNRKGLTIFRELLSLSFRKRYTRRQNRRSCTESHSAYLVVRLIHKRRREPEVLPSDRGQTWHHAIASRLVRESGRLSALPTEYRSEDCSWNERKLGTDRSHMNGESSRECVRPLCG